MRLRLCVVTVLTSVACGAPRSQLESQRGVQPRAAVVVNAQGAAGSSAALAESARAPAVLHTPRHTPEARTSILVGEKHELTIDIDLSSLPQPGVDCSQVALAVVGPHTAAMGESVSLTAHTGGLADHQARYEWSGPEQLVVTSDDSARLDCDAPATHELLLRLTEPEACRTELAFSLDCLP